MNHSSLLRSWHLPGAIYAFSVSRDGAASFPFVSPACAEIYGFTAAEAMADVRLMHEAIHPDDADAFHRAGQRSMVTLEPMRWEGRIVRPDGLVRVVSIASQPRRLNDGSTEWHGVVVDRSGLRDEVARRNRLLVERDELRTDLLGMLGHDLVTPLTAILGSAELGMDMIEAAPQVDEDLRSGLNRCLDTVMRNARHLDTLQQDLLTMAATDSAQLVATPRAVGVADHLERAAATASMDLETTVECPHDLRCLVQASHLDQMLTNLVSNAGKYAPGQLHLAGHRDGGRVVVEVTDEGPGVPAVFVDQLFMRFRRAHDAGGQAPGTGLGLYIVRVLAELNGGTVDYKSAAHGGASFVITLPAASA